MRLHELRVVGGPISCTLPLTSLHIIAGNNVHADVFDMKFQKGMLSVALDDTILRQTLTDSGENLLHPLLPFHPDRKPSKNVQVTFPANPGITPEIPLESELTLNRRTSENAFNINARHTQT